MKQIICLALLCTLIITLIAGCGNREPAHDVEYETPVNGEGVAYVGNAATQHEQIYENLALLGKVWGFVKYTHYVFVTGQLDWDAELLSLISPVLDGGDVREILYEWFMGLGDSGYDSGLPLDESLRPMADMSWINYDNLGPLAPHLLMFNGITATDTSSGPAYFGEWAILPDFSNKNPRPFMDFTNPAERLLGLFRMWNAMNYFFPHLYVLDTNWNGLLVEFIPKMLEGTDRLSYEMTLFQLAHYLRTPNIFFQGTTFRGNMFGGRIPNVHLIYAEGRLVVYDSPATPLQRGDVLLSVNGIDIDLIVAERKPFFSYPSDERVLEFFSGRHVGFLQPAHPSVLSCHNTFIYIDVLRGRFGMTYQVHATSSTFFPTQTQSHLLLEQNIGFINPQSPGNIHDVMEGFAETDGLIIDLRQVFDAIFFPVLMRQYLFEETWPYVVPYTRQSFPSRSHPGMRFDVNPVSYAPRSPYAFIYERPVVLLMDGSSIGFAEKAILSLRSAPNVTVIGTNSMGKTGTTFSLPLPGRITMHIIGTGVYTLEGEQTFRVGLAPDIRVERTIQGIADGRDEVKEAAIRFILESR